MMKRLTFKLGLFVVVWYELMVEFGLGADFAFLLSLGLLGGFSLALRLAGQASGLMGPFTSGMLIQALLWLALLWWFAPAVFRAVPLVFDLLIVLGLALAGARCRYLYEVWRQKDGQFVPADYSLPIVIGVLGSLFGCMLALRYWGSLWPLVAYVLLPALPFGFGWRMGPLASADRPDARFGNAENFRDAGLSDER